MPINFFTRAKNAWNAFINNKDPTEGTEYEGSSGYSYRPDRPRFSRGAERSIVTAVYNRIAMDVAAVDIRHVRLDENDRYLETIDSDLNECLQTQANIDQTGRSFIQDIVMSMFDEGCVAVIPVDTDKDPNTKDINEIYTMRTAKILSWKPVSVRVRLYNERTGLGEEIEILKKNALIIENPLYAVMNEPNSVMQRLVRKLSLLDSVDEQSSSGKLDLIIQLPYTVRGELRKQQAAERKQMIEEQLSNSKYGIAYIDSTEHITQLNRAVENNLMSQIEYLTDLLYSQLGITLEVLNGTADEETMLNYNNRVIEPILSAIISEMKRKWLTKSRRDDKESFMFFRDPFKLVPISNLADIADKFTRNEIMTSNEIRQIVGMKKSDDPNADQLRNKNLNQSAAEQMTPEQQEMNAEGDAEAEAQSAYDSAMQDIDNYDAQLDKLESSLEQGDLDGEDFGIMQAKNFEDWLEHYANPYYDPVKAHEYYMANRKLVERKSTSGLNEEGRAMAKYVKDSINADKAKAIEASKSSMNSKIEGYKKDRSTGISDSKDKMQSELSRIKEHSSSELARFKEKMDSQRQAHSEAMQSRISQLSSIVSGKGVSSERKEEIRSQIAKLRESNAQKREELNAEYKRFSGSEKEKASADSSKVKSSHAQKQSELTDKYNSDTAQARNEYKETSAKLKEDYDKRYEDELERIKSNKEFQKESKSKKDKDSTTSSNRQAKKVGYWEYQKSKK